MNPPSDHVTGHVCGCYGDADKADCLFDMRGPVGKDQGFDGGLHCVGCDGVKDFAPGLLGADRPGLTPMADWRWG